MEICRIWSQPPGWFEGLDSRERAEVWCHFLAHPTLATGPNAAALDPRQRKRKRRSPHDRALDRVRRGRHAR